VANRQERLHVLLAAGAGIPHFQKGHGQAPDCLALQPDAGVLPPAIEDLPAKILVRQIKAAGIPHLSVNDGDLPVIPVVHEQIQHRQGRVEHHAPDAGIRQPLGKQHIHIAHAAHIVIHEPHVHALAGLPDQNIADLLKGRIPGHRKILHEDEVFCLFQIPLQGIQGIKGLRKIDRIRIPVCRTGGLPLQIPAQAGSRQLLRRPDILCRFHELWPGLLPDLFHPLADAAQIAEHADHQIQAQAHHRCRHHQHDPWDLIGGIGLLAVQMQHHRHRQDPGDHPDPGRAFMECQNGQQDPAHLQHQCQRHKYGSRNGISNMQLSF